MPKPWHIVIYNESSPSKTTCRGGTGGEAGARPL